MWAVNIVETVLFILCIPVGLLVAFHLMVLFADLWYGGI